MNLTEYHRTKRMIGLDDETVYKHHKHAIMKSLAIAFGLMVVVYATAFFIAYQLLN